MHLDDVIQKLKDIRYQYGNIEVVVEEQNAKVLLSRKITVEHQVVFGKDYYVNLARTPMEGDEPVSVVVITN